MEVLSVAQDMFFFSFFCQVWCSLVAQVLLDRGGPYGRCIHFFNIFGSSKLMNFVQLIRTPNGEESHWVVGTQEYP